MHEKRRSHLNSGLGGAIKPSRGLSMEPAHGYGIRDGGTKEEQGEHNGPRACNRLASRLQRAATSVSPP